MIDAGRHVTDAVTGFTKEAGVSQNDLKNLGGMLLFAVLGASIFGILLLGSVWLLGNILS